jgi:hypothetical protein
MIYGALLNQIGTLKFRKTRSTNGQIAEYNLNLCVFQVTFQLQSSIAHGIQHNIRCISFSDICVEKSLLTCTVLAAVCTKLK